MEVTEEVALEILKNGILAVPTETVYGLAARFDCEDAIDAIFRVKGRPRQNPLIVHVSSLSMARNYIKDIPPYFEELANSFWPGPLSLVLPVKEISKSVTAGLDTACFRMPAHPDIRSLIEKAGPLVIPSANISGRPSATTSAHVEHDFGVDFPILAERKIYPRYGLESTILAYVEGRYKIVREGILIPEDFISTLGYAPLVHHSKEQILSPGSHFQHYSPKAQLIRQGAAEAVLGFSERRYALPLVEMGSIESAEKTAAGLYAALRELDLRGYTRVLVDFDFPKEGLWKTIEERLLRASFR